jgi:hypothetical protein
MPQGKPWNLNGHLNKWVFSSPAPGAQSVRHSALLCAPYERIIVTAAAAEIPQALLAQLTIGGVMIIPVGAHVADQFLLRLTRVASLVMAWHVLSCTQ